jgi:pimeloyl-ACP methyl ester carboxylesterase
MKLIKISKIIGIILVSLYLVICGLFYFNQEKLLFVPTKLAADYKFEFNGDFEEINIKTEDGENLNNLLFRADSTKGVIFYLHGNGGSLERFGNQAPVYTDLGYDIFMTDYRGYGKSEGFVSNENQIYQDNQLLYNELKKSYSEEDIIIVGYSLGSTFAAKLASANSPKMLILQGPFYNMKDYFHHNLKITYAFPLGLINKYSFNTNEFIQNCKMPVLIFHGDADEEVYYGSSLKLKEHFKPEDRLIILEGEKHRTVTENPIYQQELKKLFKN